MEAAGDVIFGADVKSVGSSLVLDVRFLSIITSEMNCSLRRLDELGFVIVVFFVRLAAAKSKAKPRDPGVKSEAAKAREEARKRLLAAKAAGRQRKASEHETDEVQIFIS